MVGGYVGSFTGGGVQLCLKRSESDGEGGALGGGNSVNGLVEHGVALLTDTLQVFFACAGESQGDLAAVVRAGPTFEKADGLKPVTHTGDRRGAEARRWQTVRMRMPFSRSTTYIRRSCEVELGAVVPVVECLACSHITSRSSVKALADRVASCQVLLGAASGTVTDSPSVGAYVQ